MNAKFKGSLFLVILGLFIWLVNIGDFSFWIWGRDWPWIIIIIGIMGIVKKLFRRKKEVVIDIRGDDQTVPNKVKQAVKEVLSKVEKGEMDAEEAAEKIKENK